MFCWFRWTLRAILAVPTLVGVVLIVYAASYLWLSESTATASATDQTQRSFENPYMPKIFGPAAHFEQYLRGHPVVLKANDNAHEKPRPNGVGLRVLGEG